MQIQKKCRVARPKLAGVVQPGDAAHAQLSSRKVTGGTATPTPVRPPPQEPHLGLSEPVCSWDIKSGLQESARDKWYCGRSAGALALPFWMRLVCV